MPKKIKAKKSKIGIDSLDTAYKYFQTGNLQECERICKKILLKKPDHPDTLHLLGLAAYQAGQINEAINNFRRAVKLNPQVYFYHNNLGLALDAQGLTEEAIDCYKQTIKLKPDFANTYNNLGIAFAKTGMTDDAIQNFNLALSITPDNAEIYFNLGILFADMGILDAAIDNYKKAVAINPQYAEACNRLGFIFKERGMLDDAMEYYKKLLILKPDYAEGYNNLGNVIMEKNMIDDAVENYKKALRLQPDYAMAYYNLGNALSKKNMMDEAIDNYKKALILKPDYTDAYNNLGKAFAEKGMVMEAEENIRKALELKPYFAEAYHNLGFIYGKQGNLSEAVRNYKKALQIRPSYADAHRNMGMISLLGSDFDEGWKKYEWRLLTEKLPAFSAIRWDGSQLKGRSLCIHSEQGVGDEIMFASCLTDVLSLGSNIIIECDGRLMPLFRRSFPGITLIRRSGSDERQSEIIPQTDFHIYAGSLPLFFRPDLSSFPQQKSYLIPDKQELERRRSRFKELGEGLKVGISWRGGKEAGVKLARSISLLQWSQLFSMQGVHFINLQYGDCVEELKDINETQDVTIHDWDDAEPMKDLDGFAAQIAALDLVISVDNSTVHMAGALGVPVWALLPYASNWRWMQDFEDTPWYESVRLYRQRSLGNWESVLERIELDLGEYVTTRVMPGIEHGNSYKNTGEGGGESKESTNPFPVERGDKMYKCAVITPVGPGHEGLYKECRTSINKSYNDNKGRFSEIILVRVDDTDGMLGRSRARNKGIKQAAEQGADWLFFLDADDLMAPSAFEYASNYLDKYDAVWGSIWSIEEGQQARERDGQLSFLWSIEDVLSFDPFVSLQMGHFVKTSVALSALFNESLDTGEDFDYYLRVWEKHKCIKIPLPFFYNRRGIHSQGPRSASGREWRQVVEGTIQRYRHRIFSDTDNVILNPDKNSMVNAADNPKQTSTLQLEPENDYVLAEKRVLVSILTWDAHDYVHNLLENLQQRNPGCCNFRIQILDQGSQTRTRDLIEKFVNENPRAAANFLEENCGFSVGHNKNFDDVWRVWKFDYYVVLNSDVIFDEDFWLDNLVQFMEKQPDCGIAGPHVLNYIDSPEHIRGHGRPAAADEIAEGRYSHVSGSIAIIRSSTVLELGLFDASFTPGYFEDADLSKRYNLFGYDLGYVPLQFQHHYLGQARSSAKSKREELYQAFGQYQERNRRLFVTRWMDGPIMAIDRERLRQMFPNVYFPSEPSDHSSVIEGPAKGERDGFTFDIGNGSKLVIDLTAQIRRYTHFEIYDGGVVKIGPRVVIGMYNWIQGNGGLEIGENTIVGSHVCLLSTMHGIDKDNPVRNQPLRKKHTKIGEDVFIGAHVTVAAGVTLEKGCVIGSNSYVNVDVPGYQIFGGVPARPIGERKSRRHAIRTMAVVAVGNTDRPHRFNTHTNMYVTIGNALSGNDIDTYYVCHPQSLGDVSRIPPGRQFFMENHAEFDKLLDDIQPDLIYIWNGASDGDLITRKYAIDRNIPVVYSELGWFPQGQTVYFDTEGTNARSSIRRLNMSIIDVSDQLDEWITNYLSGQNRQKVDASEFVFVPLQDEEDINITQDSPYKTMDEFVSALSHRFPDKKFIVRPHPRFPDVRISQYLNVTIRTDGNVYDWMATAGAVVGINSTVLLESLLMGRPTHSLGTGLATGLNVFFEAGCVEDMDLDQEIDPEQKLRIRKFLSELIFRRQVERSRLSDTDYIINQTVLGDVIRNIRQTKAQ